ncbi:hypothetical protein ANCCAN_10339 [Ancylostoma caninum]|uniref:SXP/RAL-2 family protein Ani s 5-like cation-binding domain-containing protein n=1 Tax=Ancylostoma caninum TaxID=29170 RepID=A0A368GL28_ANCCA|nr:hypothetical protein ANCCAN_10339 [Ancylostoma caninum]
MVLKLPVILLLAIPQGYAQPEDIMGQYIEISMELTTAMKGTGADEAELHQLAKDIVYHGDDQGKVQKLYDAYLQNKSEEIKEAFIKNYMHDKRVEYLKNRVGKVLGYYLTKEQIKNVRMVLEREVEKGSTQEEIIAEMKKELMKEISEQKAERAIERVIKDLKILGKRYVGWMEKAEKFFVTLIKHDEH